MTDLNMIRITTDTILACVRGKIIKYNEKYNKKVFSHVSKQNLKDKFEVITQK